MQKVYQLCHALVSDQAPEDEMPKLTSCTIVLKAAVRWCQSAMSLASEGIENSVQSEMQNQ